MLVGRIARPGPDGDEPRVVVAQPEAGTYIDVREVEHRRLLAAGATGRGARRISAACVPGSLAEGLAGGAGFAEAVRRADAEEGCVRSLASERVLPPTDAPAYRDFMAFEEHVVNAAARAGGSVGPEYFELPLHHRGNHAALVGPEDEIPWPAYGASMDYELELGIVIGRSGIDLTPDEALGHILGITVLNDFSLRDIQAREMRGLLGPAKAKHFATAIGSWIATPDVLDLDALAMSARVDGEEWSEGSTATLTWSIAELVAWASAGEALVPGELIGTGTVGGGSGLELGRRLGPGSVVELEVQGIGVLRNRIGTPQAGRWTPEGKRTQYS